MRKREAERKRKEGLRVQVGYMKLWVEGKLWVWDGAKDELRISQEGRLGRGENVGGKMGEAKAEANVFG